MKRALCLCSSDSGRIGLPVPEIGTQLDPAISIIIAVLMFSMFLFLKDSFANRRFIAALLSVNYLAVPIVVWLLS